MTFAEQIAARTIWSEARGEPEEGQRAVAHVLVNRIHDGRWGKSLASVCVARRQFSCWNDSDPNRLPMIVLADDDPLIVKFVGFIRDALADAGGDPTHGATHYYATSMTTPPDWAKGLPFVQIGRHRFFRDVP